MEGKGKYTGMWKNDAKIRLEYSDETLILRRNFFSKCSKNFSIGLMIMFKVCRRCLQRCSLRWKKNYERTIHTSKYIQKKLTPPLTPLRGGVNSFNATLTRFGATCPMFFDKKLQKVTIFEKGTAYVFLSKTGKIFSISCTKDFRWV